MDINITNFNKDFGDNLLYKNYLTRKFTCRIKPAIFTTNFDNICNQILLTLRECLLRGYFYKFEITLNDTFRIYHLKNPITINYSEISITTKEVVVFSKKDKQSIILGKELKDDYYTKLSNNKYTMKKESILLKNFSQFIKRAVSLGINASKYTSINTSSLFENIFSEEIKSNNNFVKNMIRIIRNKPYTIEKKIRLINNVNKDKKIYMEQFLLGKMTKETGNYLIRLETNKDLGDIYSNIKKYVPKDSKNSIEYIYNITIDSIRLKN